MRTLSTCLVLAILAVGIAVISGCRYPDASAPATPTAAATSTHDNHSHEKMPNAPKAGSEDERKLFLTPGGIYTDADIKANGNTVPTVKFKDMDWPHDEIQKIGDPICPVTKNRADARCVWVVNGQSYQFCCPPCLGKFVKIAKDEERNATIKKPEEYVATELPKK